jgi:hypothetical protein
MITDIIASSSKNGPPRARVSSHPTL